MNQLVRKSKILNVEPYLEKHVKTEKPSLRLRGASKNSSKEQKEKIIKIYKTFAMNGKGMFKRSE